LNKDEKGRFMRLFFLLLFILICLILISITVGAIPIPLGHILNEPLTKTETLILYDIRLPRVLVVALAGACLSMVGVFMQTITKNHLAEPYILGIASGASAGAVAAIILGIFNFLGSWHVYGGAFMGSCIAIAIVIYFVGYSNSPIKLILVGVGVSAFFSSLTTMIIYTSTNEAQIRSAMFWMVGSFSGIHWHDLPSIFGVTAFVTCIGFVFSKDLDVLLLGRREAQFLGQSVNKFYVFITISASLAVSVLVAKTGVIGFIGLIVPHISRKLVGVKHGYLLPTSALVGGILLIIADDMARTLFRPEELPIGIMTAVIGAPLFIHIILKTYDKERL
jgi:iron complex transport system permease protein